MRARIREIKILEPVSSTSRRGARAAYHDEYPRDFGPRIACTVILVSDTSRPPIRQGGRDMSVPRPYQTYPFHSPALFTLNTRINFYIYTKLFSYFFHVVCTICLGTLYICHVRMCSVRIIYSKVQSHCSTNKSTYESCIYKIIERTTL